MNGPRSARPDAARSRLRAILAKIDRQASRVRKQDTIEAARTALDRLVASCAELSTALALGPEPAVRRCHVCQHLGMRAATRCGYCWATLSTLGERPTARARRDASRRAA
jgi:hypothetical protein